MPEQTATFASQLENFARTIDIVDQVTANNIWDLAEKYLSEYFSIDSVSLKIETLVNSEAALLTVRGLYRGEGIYTLLLEGKPQWQSSYSFLNNKPLWVVDFDKKNLSLGTGKQLDLWSQDSDFPKKPEAHTAELKTSIFVPVTRNGRVVAIVNYLAKTYLELVERKQDELNKIAETLYLVHSLSQSHQTGSENTRKAVKSLEDSFADAKWPEFEKPRMFIASSGIACKTVTGEITNVLNEFSDRIDIVHWKTISQAGNITSHIVEEISKSKFGLCYFSEPVTEPDDPKHKYRDNANVVFEAGMLQALTNSPSAPPTGWIPIREKLSPPAPFDFAGERILIIERSKNGALNQDTFHVKLRARIDSLLE